MAFLNAYFDFKRKGYTIYTEEYSYLIRKKEITREQALKDLEFDLPKEMLERLANEIDIKL